MLLNIFSQSDKHVKYSKNLTINGKTVDGVLGIRTRDLTMVGTDVSTEFCMAAPINCEL